MDHTDLVPFPGGYLVDLFVAISTLNVIDEMGAGIMFCRFLLVAPMARDRLGVNRGPFLLDMLFDIGDIPVATVAGVCSMNRLGKLSLVYLIAVTAQAIRVIDTLITVFTAFDDKLLGLFLRLRRFHAFNRF